jgi:two-component system phosphate regulon sensor histidine kinase PhoR
MTEHPYSILIIEDDQIDRMAFQRMLKKEDLEYRVVEADSFTQARSILGQSTFDLVITDYNLGDGNALELVEIIGDTPIIIVTGAGNEEIAIKAMRAGASDYLIKDHGRSYLEILPLVMKKTIQHNLAKQELNLYHSQLEQLVAQRTEELAAEKELLGITLSSVTNGILVLDADRRTILINPVAVRMTGWSRDQALNQPIDQVLSLVNENTRQPQPSPIAEVFETRQIRRGSAWDAIVSRTGPECPVAVTVAPIIRPDQSLMGVVVSLRDVSRDREVERMKRDFVSSVSHELRTPLTSIKAFTATMLRDPTMPDPTRVEFLNIIDEESNRLADLIEDLLDISRIESGSLKIASESVQVAEVVQGVMAALAPLAEKKNLILTCAIEPDLPEVTGDAGKLQSVVTNLVNNALKFTPQNGSIQVHLGQKDEQIVLSVKDTGMGIPAESLDRIFDRFYRVNRPGKEIQGTGLGLTIVKEIVNLHKGSITVRSEPDHGSEFIVALPVSQFLVAATPA